MKKSAFIIIAVLLLFLPSKVFAENIDSFDVNIRMQKDGLMEIAENIQYNFGEVDKHGIFRDIPRSTQVESKFRNQTYIVEKILRDREKEPYTTSGKGEFFDIKIGNAERTISGKHSYTIQYTVKNGIATLPDHDELYWNINGNDWAIPIINTSATIQAPPGTTISRATCYTGLKGSTSKDCSISQDQTRYTAKNLNPHQGLTIVAAFPQGTFPTNILSNEPAGSLTKTQLVMIAILILTAWVGLNIILPLWLWSWYKKNQKGKEVPPTHVNFDLPQTSDKTRLAPALAGALDTAQLEQNDIVATIYDLAIRKHLKIVQDTVETNLVLFNVKDKKYFIEKLEGQAQDQLNSYEKILTNRLFESGNRVDIETLKTDFYKTFQKIEENVYTELQKIGYYKGNPKTRKTVFTTFGILAIFTGSFILAPLLLYLASKQTNRTKLGATTDWQIDGLKQFLQKMDRNYKWQTDQLAVVEQMIPYAMALGFIDKFMEQLKVAYPNYNPTWYSGSTPFYTMNSSLMSTMTSGFATAAPSSSSGFSGGSGGGGGGGGGGSW